MILLRYMILQKDSEGDIKWFDDLADVKPEYTPIPCWSLLQFYTLKGRTSTLNRDNLTPIRYLQYVVHSPSDGRYYMKLFRAYDLETLFFYRKSLTFAGEDEAVSNLRKYVDDGNVTLLFTAQQISETTSLLERLWKANLSGEGKLSYKMYLQILHESLSYEDYKNLDKGMTGFQTVCKQYSDRIAELWKTAHNLKK